MKDVPVNFPIGRQISLPGHFDVSIILEAVRPLAKGFEFRVRLPNGTLEEAVLTFEEAASLAESVIPTEEKTLLVDADQLRLLVESAGIRLACTQEQLKRTQWL